MDREILFAGFIILAAAVFFIVDNIYFFKKNKKTNHSKMIRVENPVIEKFAKWHNHDKENKKPEELYLNRGKEIVDNLSDKMNDINSQVLL